MKRDLLANVCNMIGFTNILETLPRRNCIVCLNYHRIGNPRNDSDPDLFSASPEQFEAQVGLIKKIYPVITLEEATDFIEHPNSRGQTRVLLTFDDGYLDNYQIAYPILRSHGVSATFFLVTSFVGSNRLPWWDLIASIVSRSGKKYITLQYPTQLHINLETNGYKENLRMILRNYKSPANNDPKKFIECLREACSVYDDPTPKNRVFMDLEEAREMIKGGMYFGSHTHTHEILGKLSFKQQMEEISISKTLLEKTLDERIYALAYPVGGRSSFTNDTSKALKDCGYRIAFSYYGGVNLASNTEAYNVRRMAIESDMSINLIRLSVITSAQSGRHLF